jgi:formate-dependent nitrite reductase membrane component NrfD
MLELTTSRANEMIDPALHVWGWEVPVYLFLGGLVAGMMIISGYFLLRGNGTRRDTVTYLLPILGMVFLTVGMLALFFDLEHKLHVWRFYTTFQITSPMSWGSWILLLVYPTMAAQILLRPPTWLRTRVPGVDALSRRIAAVPRAAGAVAIANFALGTLLGLYTGVLLSTLGARPLWNSALLGPLFLFSGLSAAAAFVHLVARDPEERVLLARADNVFLGSELLVVALFLIGLVTSTRAHAQAAALFLGGPYTAVFWIFVVGIGLVIPLIVQSLATSHRIQHTPVAPLLVLAGGLLLRFVIVYAGQASHWSI